MTKSDALTEEWVKKLQFENRVDLSLQTPTSGESMKVEVGDIPPEHLFGLVHPSSGNTDEPASQLDKKNQQVSPQDERSNSIPTNDSYLGSILSPQIKTTTATTTIAHDNSHDASGCCQDTADCVCYKCQRQRRRTGARGRAIPIEPSLTKMNASTASLDCQQEPQSQNVQLQYHRQRPHVQKRPPPPHAFQSQSKELSATEHSTVSTPEQQPTTLHSLQTNRIRSFIQRKRPSDISYERHLPQPTYSELDSIYRGQQQQQQQQLDRTRESGNGGPQSLQQQHNRNSYEISWQDEAGDDILPSLKTFQTIFEEKPDGNKCLSDLLESKVQELKTQKMQEKEQLDCMDQQRMEPNRPPKRNDCLTLSYRNGPQHTQLTLLHTIKMKDPKDRISAYDKALQHCVRADSGLYSWIKNQSNQPSLNIAAPNYRPNFTLKKSTYRSILHLARRKQNTAPEDLSLKTNKLSNMFSSPNKDNTMAPLDGLSTPASTMKRTSYSASTNNLLPNTTPSNRTSCENVDTPKLPLPRSRPAVDKGSLTLLDIEQRQSTKTGKTWSSLERKSSKTLCVSPIYSVEKIHHPPTSIKESSEESFEKALEDLCKIMTHVDRSVLQTYLEQANGDYMKALSVVRDEVSSGNL